MFYNLIENLGKINQLDFIYLEKKNRKKDVNNYIKLFSLTFLRQKINSYDKWRKRSKAKKVCKINSTSKYTIKQN